MAWPSLPENLHGKPQHSDESHLWFSELLLI